MSDFNCYIEEIEVYESSSHEERKSLSKTPKRTNIFLYNLPLQILPTMRQKKKKSIFKLFHPQNKTTENLNLRIKRGDLEVERIVGLDVNYGLNGKNIFDVPSKKNWIIDY